MNNWYVAPTNANPPGSPAGSGTLASPWDLQTALNQPALIQPGDTIWSRGDNPNVSQSFMPVLTHTTTNPNGFKNNLKGTAAAPIIMRPYINPAGYVERSGIDGLITSYCYYDAGQYTYLIEMELLSSNTFIVTGETYGWSAEGIFQGNDAGPGCKYLNCFIHDTQGGIYDYQGAVGTEIDGCILNYNGFCGSDRNHGHNLYMQNLTPTKTCRNCFVGDAADEGTQVYGGGSASVVGFLIKGNCYYTNGSWAEGNDPTYQYNLLFAGGQKRANLTVQDNICYFPPAADMGGVGLEIGEWTIGQDASVTGNLVIGGAEPFNMSLQSGPIVNTGNTVVAGPDALDCLRLDISGSDGQNLSAYDWDDNTYYDLSPDAGYYGTWTEDYTNFSGINVDWAGWQQQTGLDAHSSYQQTAPPSTPQVFLKPNTYKQKRVNVIIYNPGAQAMVAANLSSVLVPGDAYVVRDAQNYGAILMQGTYEGGMISFPMTGLKKAPKIGSVQSGLPGSQNFNTPPHTAPYFGTFVVEVPLAEYTFPTPPPAGALQIATTSLQNGQIGVAFDQSLAANGGSGAYEWQIAGLPAGLIASGSVISGAPTASGLFSINVTVNDGVNAPVSITLPLTIAPPQFIVGAAVQVLLNLGNILNIQGTPNSNAPNIGAGENPGALGTVMGAATPDLAGTGFTYVGISFADGQQGWVPTAYLQVPAASGTLAILTGNQTLQIGIQVSIPLVAIGGKGPYTWQVSTLPGGLTFSGSTIGGTPTGLGLTEVSLTVTDSAGNSTGLAISFSYGNITPPPPIVLGIGSANVPNGTVGTPYSGSVNATGGTAPYTYSGTGVPAGVVLSASTGILSGTPTAAGTDSVTITVTDSVLSTASAMYQVTIGSVTPPSTLILSGIEVVGTSVSTYEGTANFSDGSGQSTTNVTYTPYEVPLPPPPPPPTNALTVTAVQLPPGKIGVPYSYQFEAIGGQTPYTWVVTGGSVPNGLIVSPSGLLSGITQYGYENNMYLSTKDADGTVVQSGPWGLVIQ